MPPASELLLRVAGGIDQFVFCFVYFVSFVVLVYECGYDEMLDPIV